MEKTYLGDGVYVEVERGMLKLTTEDGYRATNTIFMEPEVMDALEQYIKQAKAFYAAQRAEHSAMSPPITKGGA